MNFNKDFNKTVIKSLAKQGIVIVGTTFVPDVNGNFLKGETAYKLNDNGTLKIRTYLQVAKQGEAV